MSAARAQDEVQGRSKADRELHLVLRNDLEELEAVHELVSELLGRRCAEEARIYATQLVLEEVLSNVIRHGYPRPGRHQIELTVRAEDDGVEIHVVDDGQAFDPVAAPEPRLGLSLADARPGGLGLHLLRAFVREMCYERSGDHNLLRIWV